MTDQSRTVGGSLLRQALDEVAAQVRAEAAADPVHTQVTAFVAYDAETGVQLGAALLLHGPGQSEWTVSGALSRKVQSASAPYAVRLELRGRF